MTSIWLRKSSGHFDAISSAVHERSATRSENEEYRLFMGIDVNDAKSVTFNPAHQQRVVTDPDTALSFAQFGDLQVVSLFRRKRSNHDDNDGNPLIYALKRKQGYSMPLADLRQLVKAAQLIIPQALGGAQYDIVVPLPSSSNVAHVLAKRASRFGGACPLLPCLEKARVAQVLHAAPHPDEVRKRNRRFYTSQLARFGEAPGDEVIEMKKVPLAVRGYFTPIAANDLVSGWEGRHVLLVDDIVGSGTSLLAAKAALLAAGAEGVRAMTLLSRLR